MTGRKRKTKPRVELFGHALYGPQLTQAQKRARLWHLAGAVANKPLSDDDSFAISLALMDYARLLTPPAKGRPATSPGLRARISVARAWLEEHFGDLRAKQRAAILIKVLGVAPRTITTVKSVEGESTAARVAAWAATPHGARTVALLDTEGKKGRRSLLASRL